MDDYSKQSEDGLKELNTATDEYYREKMDDELNILQERQPKKTIYDTIRIGLIIAAFVIYFIADLNAQGFAYMIFAIFLFTIASFFMGAIKKFITEGDNCSLLFRASFFLRIVLLLFFFLSMSMIFWTKNHNLNYSYWVALISFLTIATIEIVESMFEDYRNRKKYGLISRIFRIIINLYLLLFWLSSIGMTIRVSPQMDGRQLVINQVEAPYEIMLIKQDNQIHSSLDLMNRSIPITDQDFLDQFTQDIVNKGYKPMDIVSVLNYSKLEHTAEEYYQLFLYYHEREDDNILASPLISITYIDNKLILHNQAFEADRWLLSNKINDYYELEMSEETHHKLQAYIAKAEEANQQY